jgi:hypothetical protein
MMSAKIVKNVSLYTENCELLIIPTKRIKLLDIVIDEPKHFYLHGNSPLRDCELKSDVTIKKLALVIERDTVLGIFMGEWVTEINPTLFSDTDNVFDLETVGTDRLWKHRDVTQLGLSYTNVTYDNFLLPWGGGSHYENSCQTVQDYRGYVYMVVSRDVDDFARYFPDVYIE